MYIAESAQDDVDGGVPEEEAPLCLYMLIDSRDQMNINLTPQAMDVISEAVEVSRGLYDTHRAPFTQTIIGINPFWIGVEVDILV